MKNSFKTSLTSIMLCLTLSAFAQNGVTLRIGDPAPALQYSKWLKGDPVNFFDGQKLYVLEFWATWCGPCRAAMPHLTMLQKRYEGKICIVGVNIWEDVKKGKPYNTYIPVVEKFVKQNNENMGYSLFIDNNEQYMGNKWMKAAGQEGIPSTFIIKAGKIIWIGDPMALDTTLPKMLDGTYNMMAYKKSFEKKNDASQKLVDEWLDATKPIQAALSTKEFKTAIRLIDKAKAEHPDLDFALNRMKFYTFLTHVSEAEAVAFGKQWQKQDKNAAGTMLDAVSRQANLAKTTYLWAAKTYEKTSLEQNPFSFHTLATVYCKGGNLTKAKQYEERAVKGAEAALEKAKTGAMTKSILNEYKQALEKYCVLLKQKS
jgi:thiol-disulfide isomerase/thioredoxin